MTMTPEEEKAFIEKATKYKNVFSVNEGPEVLADIVWSILGAFRTDKTTEADMARSNAGMEILNYVGCSDADLMARTIVRAVINVPAITIKT